MNKIPTRPNDCQKCGKPADIFFIKVWQGQRAKIGVYSDMATKDGLKPEYKFREWIARCAECYTKENQPEEGASDDSKIHSRAE